MKKEECEECGCELTEKEIVRDVGVCTQCDDVCRCACCEENN